jgi:hypothetical protein
VLHKTKFPSFDTPVAELYHTTGNSANRYQVHDELRKRHVVEIDYRKDNITLVVKTNNSSVGIATSYGLDDRGVGVRVPVG